MATKPKTETVTIKTPSGEDVDLVVPVGMPDAQVQAMLRQRAPDLFQPPRPGIPPVPQPEMKESLAPKLVRTAAEGLPIVGALGGGLLGAPAFGAGGAVGAGLGAAGGEAAKLALTRKLFGEGPTGLKDQLTDVGLAGALAGASEIPGALAVSAGNRVLARIVEAKSAKESGDVMQALLETHPAGFSAKGLQSDLDLAFGKFSKRVSGLLRGSGPKHVLLDNAIAGTRAEARAADSVIRGTSRSFDTIIRAAKYNAGIKGNTATADQLFKFQQELYKEGYRGNPGPKAEVLKSLLKRAGEDSGKTLRVLVPEVDAPLKSLTNLHAANSALRSYAPGRGASIVATAALHPRTTALVSPVVAGAAALGASKAKKSVAEVGKEIVP